MTPAGPPPVPGSDPGAVYLGRLQVVSDAALAHLGHDRLLGELLARTAQVLSGDTAAILLLDADATHLTVRAARGLEAAVERGIRVPVGQGFAGRIAAERRVIALDDVDRAEVVNPVLRERGVRSLLGAPLIVAGRLLGVIHVGTLAPRRFDEGDRALLQLVADRVAMAIEHDRLYAAAHQARAAAEAASEKLQHVQRVTEIALAHLGQDDLMQELLTRTQSILEADTAAILLLDPGGTELVARAARGLEGEVEREIRVPVGQGFAGRIAAERQVIALEDLDRAELVNEVLRDSGVRSLLGAPLVADGRLLGVIHVGSLRPRHFDEHEVTLLQVVADRVALAIDRERVQAERHARGEAQAEAEVIRRLQAVTDAAWPSLSLDNLLAGLVGGVKDILTADVVAILLAEPDGQVLVVRAVLGLDPSASRGIRIPAGQGVAGLVVAERRVVTIEALEQVDLITPVLRAAGVQSLLGVPLAVAASIIGVLEVGSFRRRRFTPAEAKLIQLAADRAALAIEHVRLYEAERRARSEADSANQAKDEFLAVLSHELRTPLTPILTWTQILKSEPDPGRVRHAAGVIERNVRLQTALVDDLLDLTRARHGKLRLDLRGHDLRDIVRGALDAIAERASQKSIRVEWQEPSASVPVRADARRLQQVFTNILSNAVKFTPAGGLVTLTVARREHLVTARVRDTGIGIDPEFLPFLFDMFRQHDEGSRREYGGLGIGLALARQLCELHGGTIEVRSEGIGQGTEVLVELPVAPQAPAGTTPAAGTIGRGRMAGLTILVVEDHADSLDAARLLLESLGARVLPAASGSEGLVALAEETPHLILCDLSMPGMDGFQFLRHVRRNSRWSSLAAIAVSGLASDADVRRAREAGFDRHVSKPFDDVKLVTAIESVLSGDRNR
jgi:signal transduction histidine kinase/CheY-like chemotaxis protein